MKKEKNYVIYCLLAFAVFMVSLPAFGNTVFALESHDILFHTQRIESIADALGNGYFPVRVFGDQFCGMGYGSPLFYPQLFLYIPAILYKLGLNLVLSYNIFLILINIATAIISYLSFKEISKDKIIGCISAVLYITCTYRMVDLYVRASMGEFLAITFLPLCIWGLVEMVRGNYKRWILISLGFTGVLQSHILTFAMVSIVAVVFFCIFIKKFVCKQGIISLAKAIGVFLLLNVWFLVPFLWAYRMPLQVKAGSEGFWVTDASLYQLFDVLNLSVNGAETYDLVNADSMPKTPGFLLLIGTILIVFWLFNYKDSKINQSRKEIIGYIVAGVVLVVMTTNFFPWAIFKSVPFVGNFLRSFQFIWRINTIGIIFLSISAGFGFFYFLIDGRKDVKKATILVTLALSCGTLIFVNQLQKLVPQKNEEYLFDCGKNDCLYLIDDEHFPESKDVFSTDAATFVASNQVNGYLNCTFDFRADEQAQWQIECPFVYYPGYEVRVNGEKVDVICGATGQVVALMDPSMKSGNVVVKYKESTINIVCDIVSLTSALALIVWAILPLIKKANTKRALEDNK